MNYKMISYTLGWILMFEAGFMLVPSIAALAYGEYACLVDFLITAGICLVIGLAMALFKPQNRSLRARDGFIIVALSWVVLSLFGAIPFMLTGSTNSYVDALFETASGLTTTGATIFGNLTLKLTLARTTLVTSKLLMASLQSSSATPSPSLSQPVIT